MDPNEPTGETMVDNAQPDPAGGGMEMCVPLASLAQPDEGEQMQTPEVGDPVTMTVEGKITRVEGENAYVTPSAVNGREVEQAPASAPMDEESQLRDMAAGMGNQSY